ncbi:hypothetical protein DI005_00460 [Prauserella sp. PE36]|uniref:hypothetical protein n=1 Tax=Prauserella sp. PE36 TaxID=1504709 RepID=UPI000DE41307|nr:hypothetical protein [Prauserella sp. PE36]RBM24391.1 hypothetical protein DI005_00460 [Prauserella sp. PE36]
MADRVTAGLVAAVAAATAFASWGGYTWLSAAGNEAVTAGAVREEVLRAGREHVAQVTTLDYHDVDAGIDRWLAVSTGPLRDELAATGEQTRQTLRQGRTVATGEVLDAAVAELDVDGGTARMLVSVEITSAREGTEPATTRNRFSAQLRRTDGGWKLSALDQVPLGGVS